MIQYENGNSPFFIANKEYCTALEKALEIVLAGVSGYCNSYGYEIEASFQRNGLTCKLKSSKHQSTQNGVVIPVNAIDAGAVSLAMKGFETKAKVHLGKSAVKRLLTTADVKSILPAPYFLSCSITPSAALSARLTDLVDRYAIAKLRLQNGGLECDIHQPWLSKPLAFITDMEMLIRDWHT